MALGADPASGAQPSAAPATPLQVTWVTAQGSWAVVAMGRLSEPTTTFWQLLFRPAGATSWTLVTPPGVATNGGLSADTAPTAGVTVGFQAAKDLAYSPVARTANAGKTWAPGVLPAPLVHEPDTVTTEPDGSVLGLVTTDGGGLVEDNGSLTRWTTVTTARSLASTAAGRRCGSVALRAVSAGAGTVELGASCSKPGVVGIFSDIAGAWTLDAPTLTGRWGSAQVSVLRLDSGPSGTAALVEARSHGSSALVGLWRTGPTASWSVSGAEPLGAGVRSTGFGPGGAVVVVTGRSGRATGVLTVAGPGAAWTRLPAPPTKTAAVSLGNGSAAALAVSGSTLVEWRLNAAGTAWQRGQAAKVPIEYGSSG